MMKSKEFIEVTSLVDGKRFSVRAACISAVYENDEQNLDYGKKPPCTTIVYQDGTIDVAESYDEVCDMIFRAEF